MISELKTIIIVFSFVGDKVGDASLQAERRHGRKRGRGSGCLSDRCQEDNHFAGKYCLQKC